MPASRCGGSRHLPREERSRGSRRRSPTLRGAVVAGRGMRQRHRRSLEAGRSSRTRASSRMRGSSGYASRMTGPQAAARAAQDSTVFRVIARIGYVVLGIVHIVIGIIAISVATGSGGGEADQGGAMESIQKAPSRHLPAVGDLPWSDRTRDLADRRGVRGAKPRHEEEVGLPRQVRGHGRRLHRDRDHGARLCARRPVRLVPVDSVLQCAADGHARGRVPARIRRTHRRARSASPSSSAA